MITKEKFIKESVKFEAKKDDCRGGQHCGIINSNQILICEDLDIKIEIGFYRSAIKNRELALKMLDVLFDNEKMFK